MRFGVVAVYKFAHHVLFLAELAHLDVCICVVLEEEVLVLGVGLYELFQGRVLGQNSV